MRVNEYIIPYITDRFKSNPIQLSKFLNALNRIISFDTVIVLESYKEAKNLNGLKILVMLC